MNRWPVIAPVLETLIAKLAADPTRSMQGFKAEWRHGQIGLMSDIQRLAILMEVTTVRTVTQEIKKEYIEPDSEDPDDQAYLGKLKVSTFSQKRFTLQIRSITTERKNDLWSIPALERIRDGLAWQSSIDVLADVGVSVISVGDALKRPFKDEGRWVNSALLDVIFAAGDVTVDPQALDWIEAVGVSSHIKDQTGVELPASLQMIDEVIPDTFTPP